MGVTDGMGRWMGGWVDGWMGEWVGGWVDGWMRELQELYQTDSTIKPIHSPHSLSHIYSSTYLLTYSLNTHPLIQSLTH